MRVIAGAAYGERSPVVVCSETLYVDAQLERGATLALPDDVEERNHGRKYRLGREPGL
jgi:hypothetical protein